MDPMFNFDDAETPEAAIYQALGAASMCWEHVEKAGVFQSDRASKIGEALLTRLEEFGL